MNDPSRLQELAAAHLHLRPTEPAQFTSLAEFGHRLPPVGASRPAAPDATPDPVLAVAKVAPVAVASLPAPTPRPTPRPRPVQAAQSQPGLYGAPVEQANLPPQRVPARPQLFPPMLASAHATRPYLPPSDPATSYPPPAASTGSALGMARTMQAASTR